MTNSANIYYDYNHKERIRTSRIGLRPSGLKWEKGKKVSSINKFGATPSRHIGSNDYRNGPTFRSR